MGKKILILSFLCLALRTTAQQKLIDYHTNSVLDVNNIKLFVSNLGKIDSPGGTGWGGGEWLKIEYPYTILFDQGLWVIGKINDEIHLSLSQWSSFYSPGPIIDGLPTMQYKPQDSLSYRVYKIGRNESNSNPDYHDWPIKYGAPQNNYGEPKIYGDQTLWTVYNGLDTTTSQRKYTSSGYAHHLKPFPVEIQQLMYAHKGSYWDSKDILSNVVFMEWTIINKGNEQIDSTYIGLWTDIDFDVADNPPGVDTTLQLGYCWDRPYWTNSQYQPAVGYVLLYGPKVISPGSSAIFKGKKISGYKNLEMTSFHGIDDDSDPTIETGPAYFVEDAWYIAKGLTVGGKPRIDPTTGKITKFQFNGDPVSKSGWWFTGGTGGGAGFNLFTGPFNLAPKDTQWIMMAFFPALGSDNMDSITKLRRKAKILKSLTYDQLAFSTERVPIDSSEASIIPTDFRVFNNYPNPFNNSTTLKFDLPKDGLVTVDLFDCLGRLRKQIVENNYTAGINYTNIFLNDYSSGVYFLRIKFQDRINVQKIMLIK